MRPCRPARALVSSLDYEIDGRETPLRAPARMQLRAIAQRVLSVQFNPTFSHVSSDLLTSDPSGFGRGSWKFRGGVNWLCKRGVAAAMGR